MEYGGLAYKNIFAIYKHRNHCIFCRVGPVMSVYLFQIEHNLYPAILQTAHRVSALLGTSCYSIGVCTCVSLRFFKIPIFTTPKVARFAVTLQRVNDRLTDIHAYRWSVNPACAWVVTQRLGYYGKEGFWVSGCGGISSLGNVVVHDPFGGESLHNYHKLATTEAPEDTHKNFQVFNPAARDSFSNNHWSFSEMLRLCKPGNCAQYNTLCKATL